MRVETRAQNKIVLCEPREEILVNMATINPERMQRLLHRGNHGVRAGNIEVPFTVIRKDMANHGRIEVSG